MPTPITATKTRRGGWLPAGPAAFRVFWYLLDFGSNDRSDPIWLRGGNLSFFSRCKRLQPFEEVFLGPLEAHQKTPLQSFRSSCREFTSTQFSGILRR